MTGLSAEARRPQPAGGGASAAPLIARDRLVARLDRAVAGKVTVISAPAGSGKTSLLRAWANGPGRRRRLAVMQVQRGRHDAQFFWLALLDAVRDAVGAADDAEPPAAAAGFNAAAMADRVLSELAALAGDVPLVVDDLHELGSPEAVAQLSRLLANLPPRTHMVLATRHDLRLRLHQLRLVGELEEIRAAELRFSERETRELLAASGIALSEGSVARLHQRAEGLGGGTAAGGAVAGWSPRSRAIRGGVLRQRPRRRRVPDRRDDGPPAGRRAGSAAAHLRARPVQRRAGRSADRPPRLGADPARSGGRERVRSVAGPRADLVPLPPPAVGLLAAGAAPDAARRGAGPAPAGGRADHRDPGAGLPARRGSPRAGPGARHDRPCPRAPR